MICLWTAVMLPQSQWLLMRKTFVIRAGGSQTPAELAGWGGEGGRLQGVAGPGGRFLSGIFPKPPGQNYA